MDGANAMKNPDRSGSTRLRTPRVSCPGCGSRPALRITEALMELLRESPPERRMASYQCQRRGCGTIYDLTAASCQGAG